MIKRQKLITDLVNTSGAYSGVSIMKPSFTDAAIIYAIIEDSTGNLENSFKKEFDGLEITEMENKGFDRRLKNLEKKENELEQALVNKLPVVDEKDDTNKNIPLDELYGAYTLPAGEEYSEALINFIHSLKRYFGYSTEQDLPIIDFPDSSAKALHGSLIELGKISIKLRAMKEVEAEIDLNNSYNFYLQFDSVPDACKHFAENLGDELTRELLQEAIKSDKVRIYENEAVIENWTVINKRIHSWVNSQEEIYNGYKIKKS